MRFSGEEPGGKMQAPLYAHTFICPTVIIRNFANFALIFAGCGCLAAKPVSTVPKNANLQLIYLPEASL
jgi:hypothetical protein